MWGWAGEGAWDYLRSCPPYLCLGQKTAPKEGGVEWRSLSCGPAPGQKVELDHRKPVVW